MKKAFQLFVLGLLIVALPAMGHTCNNIGLTSTVRTFEIVTSTDDLEAGKNYIILSADGFHATSVLNDTRFATVGVGESNYLLDGTTVIVMSEDVTLFNLEANGNKWNIKSGDTYYKCKNDTYADIEADSIPHAYTITFEDDYVKIVSDEARQWLCHIKNSVIGNYKKNSNYQDICLYKEVIELFPTELVISGEPMTDYIVGQAFDRSALVVTAQYSNAPDGVVTDLVEWNISPEVLDLTTTSVTVTANYKGISATQTYDVMVREPEFYTYSWSVNGSIIKSETLVEGATVTPAEAPATIVMGDVEKQFMGWVEAEMSSASSAPTYATLDEIATASKTYYAVYATKSITGVPVYYEEVFKGYTDWENGEYIMVYGEKLANVFDGRNSGNLDGTYNWVEATAYKVDDVYRIDHMDGFATIKVVRNQQSPEYTHMMIKKPSDADYNNYLCCESSTAQSFKVYSQEYISENNIDIATNKFKFTISYPTTSTPLQALIYGRKLGFFSSSSTNKYFSVGDVDGSIMAIKFYIKKGGQSDAYDDFTTGVGNETSLKDLVLTGAVSVGTEYTISDELQVVAIINDNVKNETILLMKDDNQAAHPCIPGTDEASYLIHAQSDFTNGSVNINEIAQENYDQSNWIEVVVPNAMNEATNLVNTILPANSVKGICRDNVNLQLELTSTSLTKKEDCTVYRRNAMTPANFVGPQKGYFFMKPKHNELVQIVWAIYVDGSFYCPNSEAGNKQEFAGRIDVESYDYNTGDGSGLVNGQAYQFAAVVKQPMADSPASAPSKVQWETFGNILYPHATDLVIYPLNLANVEGIITNIDGVNVSRDIENVKYYNLQGAKLDTLQPGMNIMVTSYTDGTHSSLKIVK